MSERKYVIVTLADGSKLKVDQAEWPAFQEMIRGFEETFPTLLNHPDIVREQWSNNLHHLINKSIKAQVSAANPRAKVTGKQLREFRAEYAKKNKGRERGWLEAAKIHFGISDPRTIYAILAREPE